MNNVVLSIVSKVLVRQFFNLKTGDSLDVMGPQGNGFDLSDLEQHSLVLLVGGGIGVPPLFEVAKQLHERGVDVTTVLGFATKRCSYFGR